MMSSFHERQKSLFNHLKDAEEQHGFHKTNKVKYVQDGVIDMKVYKKRKHEMKHFKGKESIFKKPQDNIRECLRARKIPDYMKNPEKWVYYSLADVSSDQMSDATNAATARTFLRAMEDKLSATTNKEDEFLFKKPTFHISSAYKKSSLKTPDEEIKVIGSKIIMPEYVVGVSKKRDKNTKTPRDTPKKTDESKKIELKLQHLFDEEED